MATTMLGLRRRMFGPPAGPVDVGGGTAADDDDDDDDDDDAGPLENHCESFGIFHTVFFVALWW